MIDAINKEVENFLSSIINNKKNINSVMEKCSTAISDDLSKGHITTNVCMIAASILKVNPKKLADDLKIRLEEINKFDKVETAGPGFINVSLKREDFASIINLINKSKNSFGSSKARKENKVQIEFVSANPTGPLHVGHGRGAAYGDAIARILESTGASVEKEYYVNDAGRQIDILTASVILKLIKNDINNYFPENAYKGDYIDEIGKKLGQEVNVDDFKSLSKSVYKDPEEEIDNIIYELEKLNKESWNLIKNLSLKEIVKSIEDDLKAFNVNFDKWFYESSMGKVDDETSDIATSINKLKKDGHAYEKDKAIWLNTDISGDDKHRVLVRDNGKTTYFASDVAYHKNKIDRGFDKLINVWGADHHGYIKRIEASIENLGSSKNKLVVKLVQFANLFKDGKKIKMSTRSGEFFTLKNLIEDIGSDAARFYYLSKQADQNLNVDQPVLINNRILQNLIEDIGSDAARFYYLSKQADQHLDFDLDLAKSDSKENIFYYIQYAHARIVSLEEKVVDKYSDIKRNITNINNGNYIECDNLIHEISKFPDIVNKSANSLQPHVIIYYLKDLSQLFHSFYNDNHVLSESEENMQSIMECLTAVKQVISNGLNLLGITPMQKM